MAMPVSRGLPVWRSSKPSPPLLAWHWFYTSRLVWWFFIGFMFRMSFFTGSVFCSEIKGYTEVLWFHVVTDP